MNPLLFYFVTPTLGMLRNYIKYKQLYIRTYLRTLLVYVFFHMWFCLNGYRDIVFRTLIYERWFWFIYKSWISYRNDDYNKKKQKHIKKGRVTIIKNKNI